VTEHDDGEHSHEGPEDPAHEAPVGPSTAVREELPNERSEEPADDEAHEAASQSTECAEARKARWFRVAWNSVHDSKLGSRKAKQIAVYTLPYTLPRVRSLRIVTRPVVLLTVVLLTDTDPRRNTLVVERVTSNARDPLALIKCCRRCL